MSVYFHLPRNSCTFCCSNSGVAASGATGMPTASDRRERKPALKARSNKWPLRWLNKWPHKPRSASGITGTLLRSTILAMPPLNSLIWPVRVSLPSGKMHTSSPSCSACAISMKAFSIRKGSSLAGAMGIALAVRKIQPISGILKMRWSMTKRIGRGLAAMMTMAST